MLNKSIAFGLLAAGLMIAPTAAFAGQSQSVDQYTEQNGAAVNGSSTVQTSTTNSRQVQNQRTSNPGYGRRYGNGYNRSDKVNQRQDARQGTVQNGAATDGSNTDQLGRTNNNQSQNAGRR
ncbi:hypothetical protein NIES4073_07510 [Kalymmatonema gypsitolerans NIES-4073]|nr:hypothetical protein NIES4073_07510 [Scytonema sp. NIES-4073]